MRNTSNKKTALVLALVMTITSLGHIYSSDDVQALEISVSNIDAPLLEVSEKGPTNGNVVVTITYTEGIWEKLYRLGADGDWKTYTDPIIVSEPTTVYAKGRHHQTEGMLGFVHVFNIDKEEPFGGIESRPILAENEYGDLIAGSEWVGTDVELKVNDRDQLSKYIPVATSEELNNIRYNVENTFGLGTPWEDIYVGGMDKSYIQVADIDLSEYENWEPIGEMVWPVIKPFEGNYYGNGFTISNLKINRPDKSGVGLFGAVRGSHLDNIKMVGVDIKGSDNVGSITGIAEAITVDVPYGDSYYINSLLTNIDVDKTSKIESARVAGGIVGLTYNTHIYSNHNEAVVKGDVAGGLVGTYSGNGEIVNSYNNGNTNGITRAGGLVGRVTDELEVRNSYSDATITSDEVAGGLVGYSGKGGDFPAVTKIVNSYSKGVVTGNYFVGGLIGLIYDGTIKTSYFEGKVNITDYSGDHYVGGLVGELADVNIYDSYSKLSDVNIPQSQDEFLNITFGGLVGLAENSEIVTSHSSGEVQIESLENPTYDIMVKVGGLVGYHTNGNIRNSYSKLNFNKNDIKILGTPQNIAGGLVGQSSDLGISDSYYSGLLTADIVGGLVAYSDEGPIDIVKSHSIGTLKGIVVGGLVGYSSETPYIYSSYSTSNVIGYYIASGLIGFTYGAEIIDSYSTSLVEAAWEYTTTLGGMVGQGEYIKILNSSFSGEFIANGVEKIGVGGLIGSAESGIVIKNSYVRSNIEVINSETDSENFVGGLVGGIYYRMTAKYDITDDSNSSYVEIDNSYYNGKLKATGKVGGLIGHYEGNWYNDGGYEVSSIYDEDIYRLANIEIVDEYVALAEYDDDDDDWYDDEYDEEYFDPDMLIISNSHTSGEFIGDAVGGLISSENIRGYTRISNSYSKANLSGITLVGGLAAQLDNAEVVNSYYNGSMKVEILGINSQSGGLFGQVDNTRVINSYSKGIINVTGYHNMPKNYVYPSIGGISGYSYEIQLESSYSTMKIDYLAGGGAYVGGLIGLSRGETSIEESQYTGNITTDSFYEEDYKIVGGIVGDCVYGEITDSYSDVNIVTKGIGKSYVGGIIGKMWVGTYMENNHSKGSISTNQISSIGGLVGRMGSESYIDISGNYSEVDITYSFDLDTTGELPDNMPSAGGIIGSNDYDPLNPYTRVFATAVYYKGKITSPGYVGGILGSIRGDIAWVNESQTIGEFTGDVVGGIIGLAESHSQGDFDTQIDTSYSKGIIKGKISGGLVGKIDMSGLIYSSYFDGDIITSEDEEIYAGGIIGAGENVSIIDSYSTGNISSDSLAVYIGGLIGLSMPYTGIYRSFSHMNITSTQLSEGGYTGGLIGYSGNIEIHDSYYSGNIQANNNVGGLVGALNSERHPWFDSVIQNSHSRGTLKLSITGGDSAGGLVGSLYNDNNNLPLEVSKSYSKMDITGQYVTGGLFGYMYNSILEDSYFNGSVKGNHTAGGLIGKSVNNQIKGSYVSEDSLITGEKDYVGRLIGQGEDSTIEEIPKNSEGLLIFNTTIWNSEGTLKLDPQIWDSNGNILRNTEYSEDTLWEEDGLTLTRLYKDYDGNYYWNPDGLTLVRDINIWLNDGTFRNNPSEATGADISYDYAVWYDSGLGIMKLIRDTEIWNANATLKRNTDIWQDENIKLIWDFTREWVNEVKPVLMGKHPQQIVVGVEEVKFKLPDGSTIKKTNDLEKRLVVTQEGLYSVTITDYSGNTKTINKQINIDKTPPIITLDKVNDKLQLHVEDNLSGIATVEFDGIVNNINNHNYDYEHTITKYGDYTVTAIDKVGNSTQSTITVVAAVNRPVFIDNIKVRNTNNYTGSIYPILNSEILEVDVEVNDEDLLDILTYNIDLLGSSKTGQVNRTGIADVISENRGLLVADADGLKTVVATVTDGEYSDIKSTQFVLLRNAPPKPIITINDVSKTATINYPPHVLESIIGFSNLFKEYSIGPGTYVNYNGQIDLSSVSSGTTIYARYRDMVGNYSLAQKVYTHTVVTPPVEVPDDLYGPYSIEDSRFTRMIYINIRKTTEGSSMSSEVLKFMD